MALPPSGAISLEMIRAELGLSNPINLTQAEVRALAGKPTGPVILPNDFWGKSNASARIDHSWFERFVRNDGWDEWYQMQDTFTVVATGATILSRTWSVVSGGYYYASNPTNSNTYVVESHDYLYGGQSGPFVKVRCVVVTTAGTFTVESSL